MFKTRGAGFYLAVFGVFFIFGLPGVNAIGISLNDVSSTLTTVQVSSATNLYAYEVALDYTGTATASSGPSGFLTSDLVSSSYGSSASGGVLRVYESRLDNNQAGISGSGDLFNITYSGTITRRYLLAIYSDGSTEYVYYNGSTSTGSTTGGSSGASAAASGSSSSNAAPAETRVDFSITDLLLTVTINRPTNQTIAIVNNGNKTVVLDISSESLGDAVSFPPNLTLKAGETKDINLVFLTDGRKLIVGMLVLKVGGIKVKSLPIIINVRSENFLFDSALTLAQKYRSIKSGGKLLAQVNLQQVGRESEQVDIVATYTINDFSGRNYLEEQETFAVLGSKEYIKEIITPSLAPGKYVLALEIVYPGAFATTSSQFEIVESQLGLLSSQGLFWVLGGILVIVVIVVVWALTRRQRIIPPHVRRRLR